MRGLDDKDIERGLRALPRVKPPVSLKRDIYLAVERRKARKRWFWTLSPVPAAAALGVFLAILFHARTRPRQEAAVPAPEPVVVAPRDGEVLMPEEVEVLTYGGEASVELDGVPVSAQKKGPGAFIYIPPDLEPGYHRVVIEIDDEKVEASFYVEEGE